MFRRLLPYLLIVALVLIDVSVIPVFTASVYVLPITLMFVMCAGMLLGRMHGMLGGLLGGLLVDIFTGYPLGYMMIVYIACGYITGFMGYDSDETRAQENYSRLRAMLRRAIYVAVVLAIFEIVTIVYQYFHTALMQGTYFLYALGRIAIGTVCTSGMYFLLAPVIVGNADARVRIGTSRREVKNL